MKKVGIFYGSDTGNTEKAAQFMLEALGEENADLHEVSKVTDLNILNDYELLIVGTPTWYLGELQSDVDSFKEKLADFDLSNKTIALFGLGDQIEYSEYFLDGMGILNSFFQEKGAKIIGAWPNDTYSFSSVLSLTDDGQHFVGLGLDEDNQGEYTEERIVAWLEQVKEEANLGI